jgi:hypothetical protein
MDSLQSLDFPSTFSLEIGSEYKTGLCVVEHIARPDSTRVAATLPCPYFSTATIPENAVGADRGTVAGPIGNPIKQRAISDLVQ